jgi:metallo-beta-lactamase class B
MLKKLTLLWLLCLTTLAAQAKPITLAPDIEVEKINDNLYLHRSWLQTQSFGKVECNGLVLISQGQALVIDTPTTEALSQVLIDWLKKDLKTTVSGVIVGHFHADCLGGLPAFERVGATTYSSRRTQQITKAKKLPTPRIGFDSRLFIDLGDQQAICGYFGAGHTSDNIVTYLPGQKVLFGGCLIKAVGASKGNLEDADQTAWSHTVRKVGEAFPDATLIVPGHDKAGGRELLNYTIQLFKRP